MPGLDVYLLSSAWGEALPLAVAEASDVKGLYAKARRGELKNFTGIDSPYEAPEDPEVRIDTLAMSPDEAADTIIQRLRQTGIIP